MSTFSTSRRTRTQHVSPKISGYRQRPTTRLHIHGRIQGLPDRRCGLQTLANGIVLALFVLAAVLSAKYGWRW